MAKVYCDICYGTFEPRLYTDLITTMPHNTIRYFTWCPHCQHQETAYYLDDRLRDMQAQVRQLAAEPATDDSHTNQADELKKQLGQEMQYLKERVEGV